MFLAHEKARSLHHDSVGTEHLLLGLIHAESFAASALQSMDVSLEELQLRIEEAIGTGTHEVAGHIPFTLRAKRSLQFSCTEALQMGHDDIGAEHLLLGLMHDDEGIAVKALTQMGIDLVSVRERISEQLDTPDNTFHSP